MHRIVNLLVLLFLGVILALANIWISAARSTIPLKLDARVVGKETRTEKHPGKDDVFLLHLDPAGVLQVDKLVYEAVDRGEWISKVKGSQELMVGTDTLDLNWSQDFTGMIIAMPAIVFVLAVTSTCVWCTEP